MQCLCAAPCRGADVLRRGAHGCSRLATLVLPSLLVKYVHQWELPSIAAEAQTDIMRQLGNPESLTFTAWPDARLGR